MMTHTPKIILIAGIPATGKSTYCGWLRAARGFAVVDLEREHAAIDARISEVGSLTAFVQSLPEWTVIDWGFPAGSVPAIYLLKEAGVDLWWFDGDHDAARAAHVALSKRSIDDFEQQIESIADAKSVIENLFGENRIAVLDASGHYLPEADICRRMFDDTEETI